MGNFNITKFFGAIASVFAIFLLSTGLFSCKKSTNSPSQSISKGARIEVPKDYKTIHEAVTAAKSGDTIIIDPGTWQDEIKPVSNDLHFTLVIGSKYLITGDTNYISSTIIRCLPIHSNFIGDSLPGADISEGKMTFSGLSFLYCGIRYVSTVSESITVDHCNISGNSVSYSSGLGMDGIYVSTYGDINIMHCRINNNAGAAIENATSVSAPGTLSIINCEIKNNGNLGSKIAVAISNRNNNDIRNSNFIGNKGGLGFNTTVAGLKTKITQCSFNATPVNIGGELVQIDSSTFTNENDNGTSAVIIGGTGATGYLNSCTFSNNTTSASSAALATGNYGSGYIYVKNCIFNNNKATNGTSAIYCSGGEVHIEFCAFYNNSSTGSNNKFLGIINKTGFGHVLNCTFYGNTLSGSAGGLYILNSADTVSNDILYGNIATENGNNVPANLVSASTIRYSDYDTSGSVGNGTGIIPLIDPKFVNPAGNDFHLQAASPLIGAGDSNYLDSKGNKRNIGAY